MMRKIPHLILLASQPHYLINTGKNEVIRSMIWDNASSTEVVQLLKLGGNEVGNVAINKALFPKRSLSSRSTNPPLHPYSIILMNKRIREEAIEANPAIKGAFKNKGLRIYMYSNMRIVKNKNIK